MALTCGRKSDGTKAERPIAVKFVGALYLVWLGIKTFRSAGRALSLESEAVGDKRAFRDGVLVEALNPKTAAFFLAFIPQFLDPARDHATQIAIMGATALAFAALSDGAYALLSGKAGHLLSRSRVRLLSKLSGGFLVGGGLWLASTRAN